MKGARNRTRYVVEHEYEECVKRLSETKDKLLKSSGLAGKEVRDLKERYGVLLERERQLKNELKSWS